MQDLKMLDLQQCNLVSEFSWMMSGRNPDVIFFKKKNIHLVMSWIYSVIGLHNYCFYTD